MVFRGSLSSGTGTTKEDCAPVLIFSRIYASGLRAEGSARQTSAGEYQPISLSWAIPSYRNPGTRSARSINPGGRRVEAHPIRRQASTPMIIQGMDFLMFYYTARIRSI